MIDMINVFFKGLFGSKHERDIKKIRPAVRLINDIEILFLDRTSEDLKSLTVEFESKIRNGVEKKYVEQLTGGLSPPIRN